MLTLLPIITLIVNVALAALQSAGIVTPAITSLTTSLESTILPLVTNLSAGNSSTSDVLAVLGALSGVIATLKAQTGLNPTLLSQLNTLDTAVTAALAAYVQGGKGIDLSVLTPIPLVPVGEASVVADSPAPAPAPAAAAPPFAATTEAPAGA